MGGFFVSVTRNGREVGEYNTLRGNSRAAPSAVTPPGNLIPGGPQLGEKS